MRRGGTLRAGDLDQLVMVMGPTEATDTVGALQGMPATIYERFACSIKPLSGQESEAVRQVAAARTFEVEGYTDPKKPMKETYWLTKGSLGERKLNIAFVDDQMQNGTVVRLVCGENV
jgi:hypothetical protein